MKQSDASVPDVSDEKHQSEDKHQTESVNNFLSDDDVFANTKPQNSKLSKKARDTEKMKKKAQKQEQKKEKQFNMYLTQKKPKPGKQNVQLNGFSDRMSPDSMFD